MGHKCCAGGAGLTRAGHTNLNNLQSAKLSGFYRSYSAHVFASSLHNLAID